MTRTTVDLPELAELFDRYKALKLSPRHRPTEAEWVALVELMSRMMNMLADDLETARNQLALAPEATLLQ
jgi:hypothetical protein